MACGIGEVVSIERIGGGNWMEEIGIEPVHRHEVLTSGAPFLGFVVYEGM